MAAGGLNEHIIQNKLSNVCIITQKEIASYLIGELIISKMLSYYISCNDAMRLDIFYMYLICVSNVFNMYVRSFMHSRVG